MMIRQRAAVVQQTNTKKNAPNDLVRALTAKVIKEDRAALARISKS